MIDHSDYGPCCCLAPFWPPTQWLWSWCLSCKLHDVTLAKCLRNCGVTWWDGYRLPDLHPRKLRWQWKNNRLKMYLLLKMVFSHCHVSCWGCIYDDWRQWRHNIFKNVSEVALNGMMYPSVELEMWISQISTKLRSQDCTNIYKHGNSMEFVETPWLRLQCIGVT